MIQAFDYIAFSDKGSCNKCVDKLSFQYKNGMHAATGWIKPMASFKEKLCHSEEPQPIFGFYFQVGTIGLWLRNKSTDIFEYKCEY